MREPAPNAASGRVGRGRHSPARSAPGAFTFLETVVAAALLGIIAACILGVFNHLMANQVRHQRTLAAAELANRLILQYLDDKHALPPTTRPIAYGEDRYRWSLSVQPARLVEVGAAERTAHGVSPVSIDRFQQVGVRVWLSEESGGAAQPGAGQPEATLCRIVDPVAIRNYDSFEHMLDTPEGREELMRSWMGFSTPVSNAGRRDGDGRRPSAPSPDRAPEPGTQRRRNVPSTRPSPNR